MLSACYTVVTLNSASARSRVRLTPTAIPVIAVRRRSAFPEHQPPLSNRIETMIDEREYDARALPELRALVDALDELDSDEFDAELSADILSIDFADGG